MPIQPNFLERTAFFTLNAVPVPMLDLAGALAFQPVNTAIRLNLFNALQEGPSTPTKLLNPSQSNAQPLIQFTAEGALEDGRSFLVDVSQGTSDVANHITIEMGE